MFVKGCVFVALLAVAVVSGRPSNDDTKKDEVPRFTRTTSYHGANTRLDRPSEVGLEYYGGARGLVLAFHPVLGLTPARKEVKDEDDDVGQETEPPQTKPPGGGGGDTVVVSKPPPGASVAEARPVGVSIAGVGGTAASQPTATAVVGPAGLAISRPMATAIAGVQIGDQGLAGIAGIKPPPPQEAEGYKRKVPAQHTVKAGTQESPVVVAVAPGALQSLYYHVIPAESELKANDVRGVQYGHERPSRPVQERPQSPYYEPPKDNRGPMYGHPGNTQPTFYSTGLRYAYPDPLFSVDGKDSDQAGNLAVGQDGKYSVVPLGKAGNQQDVQKPVVATSYQFMTGGKPAVGFNQLVYPLVTYY